MPIVNQSLVFTWSKNGTNSPIYESNQNNCLVVLPCLGVLFQLEGIQDVLIPVHDTMSVIVINPVYYCLLHADLRYWPSKNRNHV